MLKRHLSEDLNIPLRDAIIIFVLLFNTLSWLYITHRIIYTLLQDLNATYIYSLTVWGVYDFSLIGAAIFGSLISRKISRLTFIYSWMLLSTIVSIFPLFLRDITQVYVLPIAFIWSVSSGIGMPSALALFANYTVSENRGSLGGVIFFLTNLSAPFTLLMLGHDFTTDIIISSVWRTLGLVLMLLLKPVDKVVSENKRNSTHKFKLSYKPVFLYLSPWLMFSLIEGFEKIIFRNSLGDVQFEFFRMLGAIIGTVSALAGGFLADLIGRKRTVIYGFISLGLAYASIGLASTLTFSWYFYSIIDGFAWGIFTVCFVLVLWGDLAPAGSSEKYYAIGSIPFFLAEVVGIFFAPYTMIEPSAAFSLASVFLFLAILPLMYAPETLPERKIELRRLKGYINEAKKKSEKYLEKISED